MKHLKLEVLRLPKGWGEGAHVRIVEQTHRGNNFGKGECPYVFNAKNGVDIFSSGWPSYDYGWKEFRVRGPKKTFGKGDNDSVFIMRAHDLELIIAAVREYNEYFSDKPKSEPKPQTGTWVVETVE